MTVGLLLLLFALVFFILAAIPVPSRVSWIALGWICITLYLMFGKVSITMS